MELEVLYHGTKTKVAAQKIKQDGFNELTYFAKDLNTAINQGGEYVFEVVFLKRDLPNNWQVRCENPISPDRIVRMCRYQHYETFVNEDLQVQIFANANEHESKQQTPYCFVEDGSIYKTLKSTSEPKTFIEKAKKGIAELESLLGHEI